MNIKILLKLTAGGKTRVVVLDGSLTSLCDQGVPLLVCLQMQPIGLKLEGAQWTARQSNAGFSVSFSGHSVRLLYTLSRNNGRR